MILKLTELRAPDPSGSNRQRDLYVNVAHIETMLAEPDGKTTILLMASGLSHRVLETPDQIINM